MTADVIDDAEVDIVVFNQLTLRLYVSACGVITLSGECTQTMQLTTINCLPACFPDNVCNIQKFVRHLNVQK